MAESKPQVTQNTNSTLEALRICQHPLAFTKLPALPALAFLSADVKQAAVVTRALQSVSNSLLPCTPDVLIHDT